MPPTFLYFGALAVWIFAACFVWLTAGLLLLTRPTRAFSKQLCFAMAGTFPFVFAYQIIAAPFVAILLFSAFAICKVIEPGDSTTTENPFVIAFSIAAFFLSLGTVMGGVRSWLP